PLLAETRDRPHLLPLYVSLTSGEPTPEIVEATRAAGGVPVLRGAVEAFTAIAAVARWEASHERRRDRGPVRPGWPALADDRTLFGHDPAVPGLLEVGELLTALLPTAPRRTLSERDSLERLGAAGLPVVRSVHASDPDAAVAAAIAIGFPVVLKLDADGLAHKTEVGGVRVGLADDDEVRRAAADLLELPLPDGATRRGLLVAPFLAGVELILGGRRDPSFGPLVVVGLGGILAEVLDDVAIRLAPVAAEEAAAMLGELRGAALLAGARGRPGIDRAAVIDAIVRLGDLLVADPAIVEVDCNPLISGTGGSAAVDALLIVEDAP
ncbi:MAG TPA: acetate--CoA ligase family protein, partial [Candidatus Deferrimicrobium sp.]|nr:acetate--CoA ligase family protein [Candidatus Deferrimicrobium sp.]